MQILELPARSMADRLSTVVANTWEGNGPEHPVDKLPLLPSGPGGVRECSVARDRALFPTTTVRAPV
jgi:hypothetical protein